MKLIELFEDDKNDNVEKIMIVLLSNCKPFLNEHKDDLINGIFLTRGLTNYTKKDELDLMIKTVRENRRPRDITESVHDLLNSYFESKYKYPYRNAAFSSISTIDKDIYGKSYLFFPVGNYKLCFSKKVKDLYLAIDDKAPKTIRKYLSDNKIQELNSKFKISMNHDFYSFLLKSIFFGELDPKNIRRDDISWILIHSIFRLSNNMIDDFEADVFSNNKSNRTSKIDEFFILLKDLKIKFDKNDTVNKIVDDNRLKFKKLLETLSIEIFYDLMDSFNYEEIDPPLSTLPKKMEIMVNCKEYIIVPTKYKNLIIQKLKSML